jgi:hypothetical protein
MELNIILMILGAAVFILPITYMLGYARHEKQHRGWVADSREGYFNERNALRNSYENALAQERKTVHALEIQLLKSNESIEMLDREVGKYQNQWKYADNYRKAVVEYLVVNHLWKFTEHGDDPVAMMAEIIKWETKMALDPAISKPAKNLITRGVRKGAKAGREQMRKQMQKYIDNQATTIRHYDECVRASEKMRITYKTAVRNVLNDKVALKGVRKSIKHAIIEENDHLFAVAAKQAAQ